MVVANNMDIIITAAAYIISCILSRAGMYAASGILLMAAAAILAVWYFARYGRRINPPAVFALSWVGGSGIACLKLSYLETDWETLTWVTIYAAYACFVTGYKLAQHVNCSRQGKVRDIEKATDLRGDRGLEHFAENRMPQAEDCVTGQTAEHCDEQLTDSNTANCAESCMEHGAYKGCSMAPLYIMMNAIAIVSVISLITEAVLLGYIPLFTVDTPHAYSYFHISGLHYFTVSCCMLPALGTLCIWYERHGGGSGLSGGRDGSTGGRHELSGDRQGLTGGGAGSTDGYTGSCSNGSSADTASHLSFAKKLDIVLCMGIGVLIPILLVSRYQLFFGILLAGCCLLCLQGMRICFKLNIRYVFAAAAVLCILVMLYVFITIERAHSVEYLNSIFEMKYEHMPIFLSQPYIYIANNFDNLNCLVRELGEHTLGLRMLFPVIALTGLKFLKPELAAFPIYVTKEELTTVTLIYDSYYDFGLIGVVIFCLVTGAAAALIERAAMRGKAFTVLLYAQVMIYLSLAFFTTWLSNPTTWFMFGLTVAGMIVTIYYRKGFQHD